MQCQKCGRQVSDGARFCPVCGAPIAMAPSVSQPQPQAQPSQRPQSQPQPVMQRPPIQQVPQPNVAPVPREQQVPMPAQGAPAAQPQLQPVVGASSPVGDKLAIASLVCGIAGIVCSLVLSFFVSLFSLAGLLLGIAGIVCAVMAKKKGTVSGIRTAGFVCSIVAVVIAAIIVLFILLMSAVFATIMGGM